MQIQYAEQSVELQAEQGQQNQLLPTGKSSSAAGRLRDSLGHGRFLFESSLYCGYSFHLFLEVQISWQEQNSTLWNKNAVVSF